MKYQQWFNVAGRDGAESVWYDLNLKPWSYTETYSFQIKGMKEEVQDVPQKCSGTKEHLIELLKKSTISKTNMRCDTQPYQMLHSQDFPSSFHHVAVVQEAINSSRRSDMWHVSEVSVCLPGTDKSVTGGGGGLTGARVLSPSYSKSVGVWGPTTEVTPGPCFPRPPGEVNMMPGRLSQGSPSSLASTRFSSARPDSWGCGVGAVTVSTGSSTWESRGGAQSSANQVNLTITMVPTGLNLRLLVTCWPFL